MCFMVKLPPYKVIHFAEELSDKDKFSQEKLLVLLQTEGLVYGLPINQVCIKSQYKSKGFPDFYTELRRLEGNYPTP